MRVGKQISDSYEVAQIEDCAHVAVLASEMQYDELGDDKSEADEALRIMRGVFASAYRQETGESRSLQDMAAQSSLYSLLTVEMMLTGEGTSEVAVEKLNGCVPFMDAITSSPDVW